MNKRPHPGLGGLPAKPYTPSQPGPAPPLPAGPPPQQQQQQYTPDQQAAHAAAWAAYYQAQGTAGAGYNAAAATGAAANPYANYGYGGGASHAQTPQSAPQHGGQQPQQGYGQGGYGTSYPAPSYAAPMAGQPQHGAYGQPPAAAPYTPPVRPYNYNGQGGQGGHASPPQQSYNYQGGNQPYYPQQTGYNAPAAAPANPQGNQGGNQSYRPSGQGQNRPYTPQPGPGRGGAGGMAPRPPPGPSPSGPGGGFPPAKRPRFEGPGPAGAAGVPPRPPPRTPQNNYGSGMARPMSGRGGAPMNAGGGGGNIPRIGFGSSRGGSNMRGGMRGGGPMRGGMTRGPPMRRDRDHRDRDHRDHRDRERERDQRDRERDRDRAARRPGDTPQTRKRKDKSEKDARTTMTDFRIVGIEVKELEWTWGLIGEHAVGKEDAKGEEKKEDKAEGKKEEVQVKEEEKDATVKEEKEDTAEAAAAPPTADDEAKPNTEVKAEPTEEAADEKRGEKRKAKPSSVDGDVECSSPKKRSNFAVTHGKANDNASAPTSSPESNQNRFRIYFESPPELDRVPKAARRNPNKRWRRESSSVAPSRIGEAEAEQPEHQDEEHEGEHEHEHPEIHEENEDAEAKPEEAAAEPAGAAEATETAEATEPADATAAPAPEAEAEAPAAPETTEATESAAPATETATDAPAAEPETNGAAAEGEDVGDVSMVTAPGEEAHPEADGEAHPGLTGTEASQAELEHALAESAANTASAYGNRGKPRTRRWSSCSADSAAESVAAAGDVAHPSVNRVSVLYEDSSRRLVFDASVVHKIRIFRAEGRIEVDVLPPGVPKIEKKDEEKKEGVEKEDKKDDEHLELPKGVLVETYDPSEQRFVSVSRERLDQLWAAESDKSLPPLHRVFGNTTPTDPITLTVFLNKKKPLSEPKWCRTNQADEWLYEQFGKRAGADGGWRGKLEIMDPDAPPTLASILELWKSGSSGGTPADRTEFTASLLASPNDLLEILLRLTRGDRNPVASIGTGPSSAFGPLATAIRPDSPYASHQTHVSLAILAMYRLTTDYAQQAGVKTEVLNDKIADIIKSLPQHMIHKSLDGLYKEWLAERKQ